MNVELDRRVRREVDLSHGFSDHELEVVRLSGFESEHLVLVVEEPLHVIPLDNKTKGRDPFVESGVLPLKPPDPHLARPLGSELKDLNWLGRATRRLRFLSVGPMLADLHTLIVPRSTGVPQHVKGDSVSSDET